MCAGRGRGLCVCVQCVAARALPLPWAPLRPRVHSGESSALCPCTLARPTVSLSSPRPARAQATHTPRRLDQGRPCTPARAHVHTHSPLHRPHHRATPPLPARAGEGRQEAASARAALFFFSFARLRPGPLRLLSPVPRTMGFSFRKLFDSLFGTREMRVRARDERRQGHQTRVRRGRPPPARAKGPRARRGRGASPGRGGATATGCRPGPRGLVGGGQHTRPRVR